ncbi:MAG: DUF4328 domain-containing protein [Bacteroidetes bacterium]|nr:DUF4328 domain-containing protein [Bacteroidota bacterium]
MYYIKLHPNQKLHRYLRITLWMLFAAYIINLPLQWIMTSTMSRIATDPMSVRDNLGMVLTSGIISLVTGLAGLVFPILFLIWMYRAYENLQRINPALPDYALGWTIGGWFVPFLNFVRPFQMIAEIWNKTQRAMRADGEQYAHEPQKPVNLWWGIWMGGVAVAIVGAVIAMNRTFDQMGQIRRFQTFDTQQMMQESMQTSLIINGIAAVFYLAALAVLSTVLKKMVTFEDELAERVNRSGYGQWGTGMPQQPQNLQ